MLLALVVFLYLTGMALMDRAFAERKKGLARFMLNTLWPLAVLYCVVFDILDSL